jgi:hypothetical protein
MFAKPSDKRYIQKFSCYNFYFENMPFFYIYCDGNVYCFKTYGRLGKAGEVDTIADIIV